MAELTLHPLKTPAEHRAFIRLPETLHLGRAGYVVPLRDQENIDLFDEVKNPGLAHRQRFPVLAKRGDRVVGRALAFLDHTQETSLGRSALFFGHFEGADEGVAGGLFDWAQGLARQHGRKELLGPWDLVSQRWGLLLSRHEEPAPILGMWNPPEYVDWYRRHGWTEMKKLVAYRLDRNRGDALPDRLQGARKAVSDRFGIRVRILDMKRYLGDVAALARISNESFAPNWGFTPVPDSEVQVMARDLKPILQKNAVLFAEDPKGEIVGFLLILPDVNRILARMSGSLFPFGFLRLLLGLRSLRHYRVFGLGIHPGWQGKGIGPLLVAEAAARLDHPNVVADIDWVLEDNPRMLAVLRRLGFREPWKTYGIFSKGVSNSGSDLSGGG